MNRPALAQTFSENANGGRFTVVVNHLKSKGSDCNAVGDPDTGDGQGNCNVTRTKAATALANWLETDPTGSGDPDFLIIGDLNSYAKEDPIKALEADGYTNLAAAFQGPDAYSYVFDGQSGYLDHALANAALVPQVTGATEWHINADEPIALDYNTNFKSANHIDTLFAPDAFRSSDHDPVIVGICQAPTLSVSVSPETLWPPNHKYRTVVATPDGVERRRRCDARIGDLERTRQRCRRRQHHERRRHRGRPHLEAAGRAVRCRNGSDLHDDLAGNQRLWCHGDRDRRGLGSDHGAVSNRQPTGWSSPRQSELQSASCSERR